MNYYQSFELADKERKGTGRFQFTQTNDNRTWPVGYCANGHTHGSKIEASDCYLKYWREQNDGKMPGGFDLESEDGTEMYFFGSY
jgi:hypothetical protein